MEGLHWFRQRMEMDKNYRGRKACTRKHFDQSINYHDDLGVIFGEGVQ